MNEMKKWKCHKEVHAEKIHEIDGAALRLIFENGFRHVSVEYIDKHKPEVGGYYVMYEDGYESFSPAAAFEGSYTLID